MSSHPFNRSRRTLLQAGAGLTLAPWLGACKSSSGADLSPLHLTGPDREGKLADGARKEGGLSFYTSMSNTESVSLQTAFERKYGVAVHIWRGLAASVVQRAVAEARARRFTVDVFETNGPEMEQLYRENLLTPFDSPHLAELVPEAVPKHRNWVADRFDYFVVAYNTTKVKKEDLPGTIEHFLAPEWKGRIGLEATDSEWMGSIVQVFGEQRGNAFFEGLSKQHPDVRRGHIVLASLVAAGEIPVALAAYSANVESFKRRGSPIDWAPIRPNIVRPQGLGIARNLRNPHAAMLFTDFLLSPEGQEIYRALGRGPSAVKDRSKRYDFPTTFQDPARVIDEQDRWEKTWDRLFVSSH